MTIYQTGSLYIDHIWRSHLFDIDPLPDYTEAHTMGLFLFDEV